jgi:hypothetical protein
MEDYFILKKRERNILDAVGIATGWMARVPFSAVQEFFLLHRIQIDSGWPTQSSIQCVRGSFSGDKVAGA